MDSYGDHAVGCGGNVDSDRIFQHNAIKDVLFLAAQSAALALRKEVPSLIPGSSSLPADVFLPLLKQGRPAALKCMCMTIISSLQQQTIIGAATTQGYALGVRENRKFTAHQKACSSVGIRFIPIAVETALAAGV